MIIYVVKPGDTVQGIAAATGSSAERILRDNALTEESVFWYRGRRLSCYSLM